MSSSSFKILGADLIAYWRQWPLGNDYYLDESPLAENNEGVIVLEEEDGRESPIEPESQYHIDGLLVWQGMGPPPAGRRQIPLPRELKEWLKSRNQSYRVITVDVPIERVDEIVELLQGRGLKVVTP